MKVTDYLEFLFACVRERIFTLRPLTHGYDSVCYEMIDNNFSRFPAALATLQAEQLSRRREHFALSEMEKYNQGMLMSVKQALDDLNLWYALSIAFYKGVSHVEYPRRILPNYRKVISFCNENNSSGDEKENHRKTNEKGIQVSRCGKSRKVNKLRS